MEAVDHLDGGAHVARELRNDVTEEPRARRNGAPWKSRACRRL